LMSQLRSKKIIGIGLSFKSKGMKSVYRHLYKPSRVKSS
jgi:hypothetical protein